MKSFFKKFRLYIVIVAVAGTSFISYSFVDNYFEVSKNLDIFATLFREINIYYVDDTDPGKLMKATGWKPRYDLRAGLGRLLESERLR